MSDFDELGAERETADHWRDLAKDRHNRILELSIEANKLKDEAEALRLELNDFKCQVAGWTAREIALIADNGALQKDRDRLTYLIDTQAIVESAYRPGKSTIFWLVFPNGETQPDVFPTAAEAIDAAMENGGVE